MEKKKRRLFATLFSVAALCVPATVFAETTPINITIPGDTLSPKIAKSDNEQRFYVTGTYFSFAGGSLCCVSRGKTYPSIYSYSAEISSSSPRGSASYAVYAKYGGKVYYYLDCYSVNAALMNVTGYYTP